MNPVENEEKYAELLEETRELFDKKLEKNIINAPENSIAGKKIYNKIANIAPKII